jgi:tetratricopeptide (TPR) repeat protein
MPSHIFVQRGMWEDVRKSNIAAYQSAIELNARMKLAEGREDFHTLGWLQYANLMLGNIDEAKANVESAKQAADRNPSNAGIRNGYLGMRARLILETEKWERIALGAPAAPVVPGAPDAHAGMPGMAMPSSNTWIFIAGYSAAKLGDLPAAESALAMLRGAREKAETGQNPYSAKPIAIMEKQVAAVISQAKGQKDDALKLAKDAMEIELSLSAPSGPPDPIKPAPELYGELLLDAGRTAEAIAALELSLQRTPNRTPSQKAMAKARAAGTAMP